MMCEISWDADNLLRVRWRCPWCRHEWDFQASDIAEIGFFVVHHLSNKHGMDDKPILAYESGLAGALREYLGSKK